MNFSGHLFFGFCLFGFSFSVVAQATSDHKTIEELQEARAILREEFAALLKMYRDSPPKVRKEALTLWKSSNASVIAEIEQELAEIRKSEHSTPSATSTMRPVPTGLSPKAEEEFRLRSDLLHSKREALERIKALDPKQRVQVMDAWHRQNAFAIVTLQRATKAIQDGRKALSTVSTEDEIIIPALPRQFPDSDAAAWERLWILRYEKRAILSSNKEAVPKIRENVVKTWLSNKGKELIELEEKFPRSATRTQ